MAALNSAQLEILKLFNLPLTEKDLNKLKQVLIVFLYERVADAADQAFEEHGYTPVDIEDWREEHMRRQPPTDS